MHAKVAARQGKRIHRAVAPKHDLPGKSIPQFRRPVTPSPCRSPQSLPDALDIVDQPRVVQVVRVPVDFTRDPVAQPAFGAATHLATVTQGWQ